MGIIAQGLRSKLLRRGCIRDYSLGFRDEGFGFRV